MNILRGLLPAAIFGVGFADQQYERCPSIREKVRVFIDPPERTEPYAPKGAKVYVFGDNNTPVVARTYENAKRKAIKRGLIKTNE